MSPSCNAYLWRVYVRRLAAEDSISLETERLTLRRLTEDDASNLVALDSDPAVMRYLSGGSATPREVIEREICRASCAPTRARVSASSPPSRSPRASLWMGLAAARGGRQCW